MAGGRTMTRMTLRLTKVCNGKLITEIVEICLAFQLGRELGNSNPNPNPSPSRLSVLFGSCNDFRQWPARSCKPTSWATVGVGEHRERRISVYEFACSCNIFAQGNARRANHMRDLNRGWSRRDPGSGGPKLLPWHPTIFARSA